MITTVRGLCRYQPDYAIAWFESWYNYGWTPILTREEDCRRHPDFAAWKAVVEKLPFVNSMDYSIWNYLRWLGYGDEPCVMTDLDTINYGWRPEDLEALNRPADKLLFLDEVDVVGDPAQVRRELLAAIPVTVPFREPDGRPNQSEMVTMRTLHASNIRTAISKQLLDPGWESAPLVHFQNDRWRTMGAVSRLDAIRKVNQQRRGV